MRKILASSVFFIFSTACVSLQTVSLTQIPAQRERQVDASVEKFIFLGFSFDNDFIDPLPLKLRDQCQNGQVKGILTKDEVTHYFIAHTRKVTAKGYCVK